jgi:hypothetical protein
MQPAAILVGLAANQSIATGQPVRIAELQLAFASPATAPMPGRTEPQPMPPASARRT